jgi:two-component system CheB/CheR fusion protein
MELAKVDLQEERVLILAPTGRDADLAGQVLLRAGIISKSFQTVEALCHEAEAGAGALLFTDEAFNERATRCLTDWLSQQPPWSDPPFLLLVSNEISAENLLKDFGARASVTILERPIHLATFTSAMRAALSARRRQYEIRDLLDRLEEANRLKDEFLATLSHELRSPLNSMVGNAEILLRSPQTQQLPFVRKSAETIKRNATAQATLISDLLDLSRVQTGKLALDKQVISLTSVINDAVETVRESAIAKQITITVKLGQESLFIKADSVRIEQVVWNLLNNSIKFTNDGGHITLSLAREQGQAKLVVEDNGQGIDPDFLPHIFDMFRQADAGTTRYHGGMGIGLALVRQLVELHGGRVEAASEGAGRGARFSVWLPVEKVQAESEQAAAQVKSGELAGLHILVVDDTPDSVEMMRFLLKIEGADVRTASSGAEALQIAEIEKFDLIISDVAMPAMDGYEMMRELRKRSNGNCPRAIAVTGFGRDEDIERARAAGFSSHITKPVSLEHLVEVIGQIVNV